MHLEMRSYEELPNGVIDEKSPASKTVEDLGEAEYWQGPYLENEVPLDPWRNAYQYQRVKSGISEFSLFSLGADGSLGGENLNADIGYLPDN